MGTANFILFAVCAVVALFGAVTTVAARRPLRAAMALMIHIIALAGLYLTLSAQLLAAIQLLVYAGAVVVLFIFVIMLIGPAAEVRGPSEHLPARVAAIAVMAMVTGTIAFSIVDATGDWYALRAHPNFGTVEALGAELYTRAIVPFEIISITLLVAIVGAVAVARHRSLGELEQAHAVRAEALRIRSGDAGPHEIAAADADAIAARAEAH